LNVNVLNACTALFEGTYIILLKRFKSIYKQWSWRVSCFNAEHYENILWKDKNDLLKYWSLVK